jgi:hypothetical protein
MDHATEILFAGLRKNVFVNQDDNLGSAGEARLRLASLLPGLAKWGHLAMNGLPNELVDVRPSFFKKILVQFAEIRLIGFDGSERMRSTVGYHLYIL